MAWYKTEKKLLSFWAVTGRTVFPFQQKAFFDPEFDEEDSASIAHELFHVLGRQHEHQREDRDDHIIVMPGKFLLKKRFMGTTVLCPTGNSFWGDSNNQNIRK
uniref:Peptidase M12A domain-containing protein n=1 Tax=Ditylenchus dipsaci TaxID=166011 RepID=A0A915CUF1_9BILA